MKIFQRMILILVWGAVLPVLGSDVSEYSVKAAYLYNFTRFVEWPAGSFGGASSPLVIGVLGEDPFGGALEDAVNGKSAEGHPLAVKRISHFSKAGAGALKSCQILFVAYSEKEKVSEILEALQGTGVLTVSDIDKFLPKGGMVLFDQEGEKITLAINPKAAEEAGLSISSKLLQAAKIYK